MHERDPRIDLRAGRHRVAGDDARLGQRALGGVDDRAQAQRLLDDRVEVGVALARGDLRAQALERLGIAQQAGRTRTRGRSRWSRGRRRAS